MNLRRLKYFVKIVDRGSQTPAADVLLLWQCEAGHKFAATPDEQRNRPGRERRRSAWCPECTVPARPARALPMRDVVTPADAPVPAAIATPIERKVLRPRKPRRKLQLCPKTPDLPPGTPFRSECAPRPASAIEAQLRADLFSRVWVTAGLNAVRVARPFFDHHEVWPDILLPELRIAVEYDSTGRHGLEHVGKRADADRRKDRALRAATWEVVRIRMGKLEPLGPYDLQLPAWSRNGLDRLIDTLRDIRGPLLVDPYLS